MDINFIHVQFINFPNDYWYKASFYNRFIFIYRMFRGFRLSN